MRRDPKVSRAMEARWRVCRSPLTLCCVGGSNAPAKKKKRTSMSAAREDAPREAPGSARGNLCLARHTRVEGPRPARQSVAAGLDELGLPSDGSTARSRPAPRLIFFPVWARGGRRMSPPRLRGRSCPHKACQGDSDGTRRAPILIYLRSGRGSAYACDPPGSSGSGGPECTM